MLCFTIILLDDITRNRMLGNRQLWIILIQFTRQHFAKWHKFNIHNLFKSERLVRNRGHYSHN